MADKKTTDIKKSSPLEKATDGTITLTISIPKADIAKTREEVIEDTVKKAQLPGFREGKAPRKLVEESLNEEKIREEILKKLLPKAYSEAVTKNQLKPIINPKIHVSKIADNEDWEFTAITCEMPEVKLGKYKEAIAKITAKSKIVIPGKEEENKKPNFDEIVKVLLENAEVAIPSILIESESDRLLGQLLGEIKQLGLSLDQYLASTKKSPEDLRAEYAVKAKDDITLEFVLQKVADEEKITVEQKELEEALNTAKSPQERAQLESNIYFLASILKQQKTLDFLKNL